MKAVRGSAHVEWWRSRLERVRAEASLVVQWLGVRAPTARSPGFDPWSEN